MLKKIRVILSILIFTLITFFFVDFAGLLPNRFHVLAHIQFVPALLGGSFAILAILIILTLLFGRIYCSSICPMGVFQDIVAWISKRTAKKKKKYTYSKAKNVLRWSVLVVTAVAFFLGFTVVLGLVDPYAAYGRMATHLFKPVYQLGNNLLAAIFTYFGNYTFYRVKIYMLSISSFIIALTTFVGIGFFAWKYGRTYCNTICPVGTILGFISKYSRFKVRMNEEKCNSCGLCAMSCKASCIDSKERKIDYSRCVDCFNCLQACNRNAMTFSRNPSFLRKQESQEIAGQARNDIDESRRKFFLTGLTTAAVLPSVLAKEKTALLFGENVPTRQTPISPPGSKSAENLLKRCSSCHLCISKCPSKVLKPAFMEYGLGGMMQPMMYFEKGFCNYNCTVCSQVCPNRAIVQLTKDEKHRTQVGHVVFVESICIVKTEGTSCGACAEHCPTQAVKMIPYKGGLTIPNIETDICIGCGGCEFICPVRPHRAIFVEGNSVHKEALVTSSEEKDDVNILDFGF